MAFTHVTAHAPWLFTLRCFTRLLAVRHAAIPSPRRCAAMVRAHALTDYVLPLEAVAAVTGTTHHGASALGRHHATVLTFEPRTVVDLARVLHTLRSDKRHAALAAAAGVTVYTGLRPTVVKAEVAALVGLAFCKLFHNALVHAFPCDSTGHVGIHLWPVATLPGVGAYLLIADDGQGFDDESPATPGRGLSLARHCIEQCGGTLTREAGSGTVWRITLPL